MQAILAVTIPFFAIVLCGYLAARQHVLPESAIPGLNAFVLYFALPCMLFRFGMNTPIFDLLNPVVLVGLFTGAMSVFVFSGLTMQAVGRTAALMVAEVRRQFREIPGILEGRAEPDYARCIGISTRGAQREMILPSCVAVAAPVAASLLLGVAGVIGLLVGSLCTGFAMAVFLSNSGGAWDNAKKYIEDGNYGGKGSEAHKAAVTGDTVGDPYKDTAGPAVNPMIKITNIVALLLLAALASGTH